MAFWRIVHRCFLTVSQEKQNYGPARPTTQCRLPYSIPLTQGMWRLTEWMKRTIYHQLLGSFSTASCYMELRRDYYLSCPLFFLNSFVLFILSLLFLCSRRPLILYWSHISNFFINLLITWQGVPVPPHSVVLTKDRYGTTRPTEDGDSAWTPSGASPL